MLKAIFTCCLFTVFSLCGAEGFYLKKQDTIVFTGDRAIGLLKRFDEDLAFQKPPR